MKRYLLIFLACSLMAGCTSGETDVCSQETYIPVCFDETHTSVCYHGSVIAAACSPGMTCQNGICGNAAGSCISGQAARCEGNVSVTCVNGEELRESCRLGCADGVCAVESEPVCVPGCLDDATLVTCEGGVEDRVPCANGCVDGACLVAERCVPRCDGDLTLVYCDNGIEQTKICEKGCKDAACVDESICGNGRLETGELCDGQNLGNFTCHDAEGTDSRAQYSGMPECNASCNGVTLGTCEMTQCGNGRVQPDHDELCDYDMSGNSVFLPGSTPTCDVLNTPGMNYTWLSGTPSCSKDCKGYGYGTCVMEPQPLFGINTCHFQSLEKDESTKSVIGLARIKPREDATADLLKGRLACGSLEKPTYEWKRYEARFTECADCAAGEYEMVADFSYEFVSAGTHHCVFQVDLDESDLSGGSLSTEYVNCPIVYGNPHPQKAVSDAVIRTYDVEAAQIDGVVLAHWDFSGFVKDDRVYTVVADEGEYKGVSVLKLSDDSEIRMLSKTDTTDAAASGMSWSMSSTLDLETAKHFVFRTKTSGYENIRFQFNVAGSGIHEKHIRTAIEVHDIVISVGSELNFSDRNTYHAYPLTVIPEGYADDASELELRVYTWGVPDVNATVRIDDIYIIGDKKSVPVE